MMVTNTRVNQSTSVEPYLTRFDILEKILMRWLSKGFSQTYNQNAIFIPDNVS